MLASLSAPLAYSAKGADPFARAEALVAKMTLDEKLALFHGSCKGYVGNVCANDRLGIPAIKMNDGPQGFRDNAHPGTSTAWPAALAIAASFDLNASFEWGAAMGREFYNKGSNVQLGPGMCVARVPRNGRNFEYISGEDPFLGYQMVQPVIKGIQGEGVVANAKHWVNNNQETWRGDVDEEVDERTQFEMYYPPFEGAVQAGVGSFMCSYNKIRGNWSCENPETLQRDLKERLGFKGWVMSDWGATHSMSINAGLDQEMPGAGFMSTEGIKAAMGRGEVSAAKVDDSAVRILAPLFAVGAFDKPNPNTQSNNVTSAAHNALARALAAQGIVLLKNEGGLLPLPTANIKLALIGGEAKSPTVHGGGSGQVVPYYTSSPYDAIREALGIAASDCSADGGACVHYDDGSDVASAAALAKSVDVALVFLGSFSSEGSDRKSLSFGGNSEQLVPAVAAANAKTAVLTTTPGAALTPWRDHVAALTAAFMPGQEYGHALADVIFGGVSPSAKLPLTFPAAENEVNFTQADWPGVGKHVATYSERLLIGYRWYDAHGVEPAFPFGHGLTYSTFSLGGLVAAADGVSVVVTNTGAAAATETVQLYLRFPAAAGEPPKQLKGFAKVQLPPKAQGKVHLPLSARDRSVWDVGTHAWVEAKGDFVVFVGTSSRDPGALTASFTV